MPTHGNQQSKRPRRDEDVEAPVSEAAETTSKADLDTTPVIKMELQETNELPESVRGEGGFGSTGK